jgi:hypothetical protein
MNKGIRLVVAASVLVILGTADSFAITRVTRQLTVFELATGYADPIGNYDRIFNLQFADRNFVPISLGASDLYKGTYHLGVGFGQVWGDHLLGLIRFDYTKIATTYFTDSLFYAEDNLRESLNQYDFKLDLNFQFDDIGRASWTPYVGLGFTGGWTRISAPGYHSSSEANVAVAANFGAEFKVWQGHEGRNFVTIGSINSIDFAASGYRPRYLSIGVGLRYYMRP